MTRSRRDREPVELVPTLHLVIPFLNEFPTLERAVRRVVAAPLPDGWTRRSIMVDDGSRPDAARLADALESEIEELVLLRHPRNRGKGAAVRTGFQHIADTATDEDVVGIQDADLEYDPADLGRLLDILCKDNGDAIYGNRWTAPPTSLKARIHRAGNRMLTRFSNACTGFDLADMECCYKLLRMPTLRTILPDLDEERFGIEPQITAALARHGARVLEGPVSYKPRGFEEGKKIGLRDAVEAIRVMRRERRRTRQRPGAET